MLTLEPFSAGLINMDVQLQRSLLQPEISGSIQFSKGSVAFLPEGAMPASDPAPADTADGHQAELISKAFAALQSSKDPQGSVLARQPSIRIGNPQVCCSPHLCIVGPKAFICMA